MHRIPRVQELYQAYCLPPLTPTQSLLSGVQLWELILIIYLQISR